MDGFEVGSYTHNTKQQVISDTGTSWLGGPSAQIREIATQAHATYDSANQIWTVSCTAANLPNIVLTIGGQKYSIPSAEYVLDVS